jgi:hypothetical protein
VVEYVNVGPVELHEVEIDWSPDDKEDVGPDMVEDVIEEDEFEFDVEFDTPVQLALLPV